jgi:hypothetical protein
MNNENVFYKVMFLFLQKEYTIVPMITLLIMLLHSIHSFLIRFNQNQTSVITSVAYSNRN